MKKIVLVTGGTAGIGKETALQLAQKGFHVVLTARNEEKGESTSKEIRLVSGNTDVDYLVADLSSMEEVRKLAATFTTRYPRLDVLINNAGAVFSKRMLSADGVEMTFATNHLAPFLLTHLLLDVVKTSAPARIINVSSGLHYQGKLEWDNMQGEKSYSLMKAYALSKLCNVLFTVELAERLYDTGVTVNCLHPGVVKTELANKHTNTVIGLGWKFITGVGGISEAQGARTSVYLATADDIRSVTGKYFDNCREKAALPIALDKENRRKLWELSEVLTQKKPFA